MKGLDRVRSWFTETRGAEGDYTQQLINFSLAAARGGQGLRELPVYSACLNQIHAALTVAEVFGEFSEILATAAWTNR